MKDALIIIIYLTVFSENSLIRLTFLVLMFQHSMNDWKEGFICSARWLYHQNQVLSVQLRYILSCDNQVFQGNLIFAVW